MGDTRHVARELLAELNTERLGVILTPAPRPQFVGHMVRTVTQRNPAWYRGLWGERGQTSRRLLMRSLNKLSIGHEPTTVYDFIALGCVKDRVQEYAYLSKEIVS